MDSTTWKFLFVHAGVGHNKGPTFEDTTNKLRPKKKKKKLRPTNMPFTRNFILLHRMPFTRPSRN